MALCLSYKRLKTLVINGLNSVILAECGKKDVNVKQCKKRGTFFSETFHVDWQDQWNKGHSVGRKRELLKMSLIVSFVNNKIIIVFFKKHRVLFNLLLSLCLVMPFLFPVSHFVT